MGACKPLGAWANLVAIRDPAVHTETKLIRIKEKWP